MTDYIIAYEINGKTQGIICHEDVLMEEYRKIVERGCLKAGIHPVPAMVEKILSRQTNRNRDCLVRVINVSKAIEAELKVELPSSLNQVVARILEEHPHTQYWGHASRTPDSRNKIAGRMYALAGGGSL